MTCYYGTAVRTAPGAPRQGQADLRPPAVPLRDIEWCEEASCPRAQCVECKKRKDAMTPLNQQLDLDGRRHDIAPAHKTQKLFDSGPQIRGQIALDTDAPSLDDAKSFYVQRVSPDGRPGWTGALRPRSRAEREAQAWRSCGWTAVIVANTPEVRARVRRWERRSG